MNSRASKSKQLIPVVLFAMVLLSPLLPTGLELKKYTRLNELILLLCIGVFFAGNAIKGSHTYLRKIELLILANGLALLVSILYGYAFLKVIPTAVDFYQVFNIVLFLMYFRMGTYFEGPPTGKGAALIILFVGIAGLCVLSILQLFPWGYYHILPLYMPKGMIQSSGYETVFMAEGSIRRIVGIVATPTSFSFVMMILATLVSAWILYRPGGKRTSILFPHMLFILSVLTLALTFARSGIFALVCSMFYLLLVSFWIDRKSIFRFCLPYLAGAVLLIPILSTAESFMGIRTESLRGFRLEYLFTPQEELSYRANGENISDLENRILLWKSGLRKAVISPVFGWGPANANALEAKRLGLEDTDEFFYGSHNEYIELCIQLGLAGLVLLISFFAAVFRRATRLVGSSSNSYDLFLARSVQAIIIGMAIFSLNDGFWNNAIIPPILMLIFGALYARPIRTVVSRSPVSAIGS